MRGRCRDQSGAVCDRVKTRSQFNVFRLKTTMPAGFSLEASLLEVHSLKCVTYVKSYVNNADKLVINLR